ncbi:hypothetical protein [Arthronema virus TR020]|uniref:Uncharacterized protein n=1 Tax=Arthronema virus TR020 TaxID=2736280 RepID=A0A7G3WH46_9CAUD|nr:hypothetical protein [Arthronema virus TR020]
MSTNPILSAQEGAQPDERVEVPTINSAPPTPAISPGDESIIPAAASVLESQPDPSQAMIDPMQVDPMEGGDPNAPLQIQPVAPVLNPEIPLQPVLESTPGFNEALDSQNKVMGVQDNIQNTLSTTVLPTDMQLPELFVGDPEAARRDLANISQRFNDVLNAPAQPTNLSMLDAAMKADAAKPKDKGFMQWLLGSGNTYNDFRPEKGQWGDYGSGALGATMYTLGLLGKAQATILGGATDSIVTAGNLIDAVKTKGFNPFSAEWRRDFDKEYQRNVFNSLPDPVLAAQTAKKPNKNLYDWADYLGSRSYTLAPLLTPGRDLAFSNWQQDRSGRNNPLGFLYGKQSTNENKFDITKPKQMNWGNALGALALDIIVDPTNLLRKPVKKAVQMAVKDVAQEAAEQATRREAGRAVMIGLNPVAARARDLPLPNGGVMRQGSQGAAFVRPVEVVKKYRAYQQRLALPPAKETGSNVIDAEFTVVKGEIPNMPRTVRQVAEQAADNPSVLEDLAKRFQEVDGREFPRGALNVELDQYAAEVAKAKTDKGRQAARNRLMARVDKLESKWNEANPRTVDFVSKSDMSRYDMSIYDDALLTGSNETPLKALPASGETSRVQYEFDPQSSPTLVVDRKGRFIPATPDTIRQVYKDNFEAVKLWKRAALPSESMRTQRMGVLQTEGRVVLNDVIDEGVREFRRTETQPVLPPAREGYTEYTLLPRTYVHDPETQKAISTFIDASGTSKRTQQRAYLESDYESIGERRLAATAVDLGDAQVVLPTVKMSLEDARKVFDGTTDVQPVRQGLESLLRGTRETFDGVTMLNRGELEEFTQRMNGNAPELLPPVLQNPTAVPIRLFAPQSDVMRLIVSNKPDVVDVFALDNLSVRNINDLNKLVEYLPAPDGKRLLDRSYTTFDGLTSAIQRRLTGYSPEVIEHYLATVSRLGQKVQGLEGDLVEVLVNRGTGDSLPGASVLMSKPVDDLPRLPYAEPNGIPSLAAINEALDNGLDPNRLLDNLTEPSLSDPIVRRNILENTPEEYRGIRPETQEMTIKRVELERELDDIINVRAEVERTKDAINEKLQDVLDEVDTLPDIGLKPLPGTAMKDVPQLLPSTLSPTGVPLAELRQPLPELKNALPRLSMDDLVDEDGFRLPPETKLSDLAQDKFDELFDYIDEIDPTGSFKMSDLKGMSIEELDNMLKGLSIDETPFYHGSRVQFLKLENVDPLEGAARGEFGTALYITSNPRQAEAHAMADLSPNLPVINNRVFGDGAVHELSITDRQGVINADDVASVEIKTLAKEALASVVDTLDPTHRKIIAALRSPFSANSKLTVGGLYDKMHTVIDKVMKQDPSYSGIDEALILEWQRAFNLRLRQAGVTGIEKGDTLAVIDSSILSTRHVKPYGNELESPLSVAASRYNAVTMALANNPKSTLLQVQQKESLATLLTRLDDRLERQLDDLDEQVIRQLSKMTNHDETLRNIVDGERAQRKALIDERLAEADAKTLEPKPFNTNPCL